MSGAMPYVIGGLKTVAGAGSEIVAPGNPMGFSMIGSGVGDIAGNAAGGSRGAGIGDFLGSLGGMFGGGGGGSTGGFSAPGANGTPSLSSMAGSLPSWLSPSDIAGVSNNQAPQGFLSMLGLNSPNGIANLIGGATSAAGTVAKNQPPPPQPIAPKAPAFSGGGSGIPGFGQNVTLGPPIRNTITPPTPSGYRILQALGFQG